MDIVNSGKSSISTKEGVVSINRNDDNFLFYDGSVYRMVIGFDENNNPKVKISENGVSVLNASDGELIFNSDRNLFKILDTGFIDSPAWSIGAPGAGNWTNTVAFTTQDHGLGYRPAVLGFLYSPIGNGTFFPFPYLDMNGSGTSARWIDHSIIADEVTISYTIRVMSTGPTGYSAPLGQFSGKYFLLQETAV